MKGRLGSASGFDGKGMKEYYRRAHKARRRAAALARQAAVKSKAPDGVVVVNPSHFAPSERDDRPWGGLQDSAERDRLAMKKLYQEKSGDYSY